MCYFTHGIQAILLSQNQVNFYTQWGYTDPGAGAEAVSLAIAATGLGKFLTVWIGGEVSDRIGRKRWPWPEDFIHPLLCRSFSYQKLCRRLCLRLYRRGSHLRFLGCVPVPGGSRSGAEAILRRGLNWHQGLYLHFGNHLSLARCLQQHQRRLEGQCLDSLDPVGDRHHFGHRRILCLRR